MVNCQFPTISQVFSIMLLYSYQLEENATFLVLHTWADRSSWLADHCDWQGKDVCVCHGQPWLAAASLILKLMAFSPVVTKPFSMEIHHTEVFFFLSPTTLVDQVVLMPITGWPAGDDYGWSYGFHGGGSPGTRLVTTGATSFCVCSDFLTCKAQWSRGYPAPATASLQKRRIIIPGNKSRELLLQAECSVNRSCTYKACGGGLGRYGAWREN